MRPIKKSMACVILSTTEKCYVLSCEDALLRQVTQVTPDQMTEVRG